MAVASRVLETLWFEGEYPPTMFRPLCSSNTGVSDYTLCPLGQPKKAIGHESQIGPWLPHSAIVRLVCFRKRMGAVTTGKWNHREEEESHRFV